MLRHVNALSPRRPGSSGAYAAGTGAAPAFRFSNKWPDFAGYAPAWEVIWESFNR